jgi:RNA polymerase sigma-70 factor (ECF subfamily)
MLSEGGDEDAALMVEFVATRDRRMFQQLFLRHRRAIVAYAQRYVRSPARAEELAQEIFVRVYTTKTYTATATFRTWLYRVATNVCLNDLRRPENKQRMEPLEEDGASTLAAPAASSPEAQLSERQLAAKLNGAMDRLPEKQRAAFIMARHENLSHGEIAEALSTTVPAVKSLIHRALETLRAETAALLEQPLEAAEPARGQKEARS